MASTAAWITSCASNSPSSSGSLPRLSRDMSRMSEIMRACMLPLRSIAASPRIVSSLPPRSLRMCVQPMMAFSGVRSSCDSTAMKSSFMRLMRSAVPRASRSRVEQRATLVLEVHALRDVGHDDHADAGLDVRGHRPLHAPPACRRRRSAETSAMPASAPRPPAAPAALRSFQGAGRKSVRRWPTTSSAWRASSSSIAGLASMKRPCSSSRPMPPGPGRRSRGTWPRCGASRPRPRGCAPAPAPWRPAPPARPDGSGRHRRRRPGRAPCPRR